VHELEIRESVHIAQSAAQLLDVWTATSIGNATLFLAQRFHTARKSRPSTNSVAMSSSSSTTPASLIADDQ